MKVSVSAWALATACDQYITAKIKQDAKDYDTLVENYMAPKTRTVGWGPWRKVITEQMDRDLAESLVNTWMARYGQISQQILDLRSIAKYKAPQTLMEITSEELGPLCKYLPECVSERI